MALSTLPDDSFLCAFCKCSFNELLLRPAFFPQIGHTLIDGLLCCHSIETWPCNFLSNSTSILANPSLGWALRWARFRAFHACNRGQTHYYVPETNITSFLILKDNIKHFQPEENKYDHLMLPSRETSKYQEQQLVVTERIRFSFSTIFKFLYVHKPLQICGSHGALMSASSYERPHYSPCSTSHDNFHVALENNYLNFLYAPQMMALKVFSLIPNHSNLKSNHQGLVPDWVGTNSLPLSL
ncbi:ATP-dependent helicase/nuclease subunit A [Striga asiatica]|uniref:ATP-dependent helicase/nuclease subunit A n=1 Tax=Striga asiatica TaxID=4170 RepID=A0A5A7PC08_STRAF|nr:ATP-dependent helicase/nuclease subunit A [Striga asiatica]